MPWKPEGGSDSVPTAPAHRARQFTVFFPFTFATFTAASDARLGFLNPNNGTARLDFARTETNGTNEPNDQAAAGAAQNGVPNPANEVPATGRTSSNRESGFQWADTSQYNSTSNCEGVSVGCSDDVQQYIYLYRQILCRPPISVQSAYFRTRHIVRTVRTVRTQCRGFTGLNRGLNRILVAPV